MAAKEYKVTGPFVTYGAAPGDTFTAELDEEHEAQLIEQGAIEVVTAGKAGGKGAGGKSDEPKKEG